jgi:hypothetical protein
MTNMTAQEHLFEQEFAKIAQEYRANPGAHIGQTLVEMKEGEQRRADRLIRAAMREFGGNDPDLRMDADTFGTLVAYTGRIYGPQSLYRLDHYNAIQPKAYAEIVSQVWSMAEFPSHSMSRADWRRMWRKAGFTMDGTPADRPTEPVRVWRAATPRFKGSFAWTDDKERALWFLRHRRAGGRLYTALVPPGRLLARIHESGRRESEWIVDTRGVAIEEA